MPSPAGPDPGSAGLLDDLDPDRRRIVEAEVPLVPRLIVLHVFGPGYRRPAAARWSA